ncbi:MAG: cadherin-like beta sandwich domain-containing protein [Clostridiales bacterium]|nr:cadherin-like beta sandwich domain-containing protein [Clostridiales bacterium]
MRKICVSVLLPLLFSVAVVFSFAANKRAAGGVTVNLSFRESSSQTGEIVSLDVRFSSFPSITRFGPIEIGYDANALEFVGIDLGEELEGFTLEKEQPEGEALIRFSAVNEEAEASIMQGATENEKKDPTSKPTDKEPVFSTDSPLTVATLRFRISDQARGEVKAWLGTISGLRDSSLENVVAGTGTSGSLIVQAMTSSDATLSALSIGSFKMEPEFDPGIFEYSVVVSKNITDVAVTGVAYNVKSTVTVEGGSDLQIGNNTVLVRVVAEDGEAVNVYTINIYRSDSLLVEGIELEDNTGKIFEFVQLPESLVIPANFYQSTCMVNGKEVPCFRRDGVLSVLIYVYTAGGEPGLYVYNQETGTMRRYEPGKMLLRSSLILTVAEKPMDVVVPEGFSSTMVTYGSTEIEGYVSKDGSTKIAYLKSEDGTAKFYVIDSAEKDFYPYKAPSTHRNLFLYLFIICASIAVVEALIIGILFYRRRIAFRRQVKPRRV